MEYSENEDDVDLMIKINKLLGGSPFLLENTNIQETNRRKEKYEKIKSLVNEYLKEFCEHIIIEDVIDIDPDRSKYIRYCEKCESTFQVKKIYN